tara:strand:- start:1622 stop:1981 length:360 start_codon:yes stop_codon:yes gene_type:complete
MRSNRSLLLPLLLLVALQLPAAAQQKTWLKNTATKRARAVGIAASLACLTNKGRLTEDQSLKHLLHSLKRDKIYETLSYLKSVNGTKAMHITYGYLNSDCASMKNNDQYLREVIPYIKP